MNPFWFFAALALLLTTGTVVNMTLGDESRDQFDALFNRYGKLYGVKPYILKAIAMIESDLGQNPRVLAGRTSYDGKSWGLMQIAPRIGSIKEIELKGRDTTPEMLNDPETSIELAAKLLGYLSNKYRDDEEKIVLSYNQGEKNTDRGKNYTHGYYKKFLVRKAKLGVA